MKNLTLSNFFSAYYFKDLKVLLILESIILILLFMLSMTPSIIAMNLNYFNIYALIIALFVWVLSSLIDPKKHFNFATLIGTGFYSYLCFWFVLTFFK